MNTPDKMRYEALIAAVLLLALFSQAALSSIHMSLTTDEPMHIAMGYTNLSLGDYRLLPAHIHPPLINDWAAWPLLLRPDRPDPRQVAGWDTGNLFKFSAQLLLKLGPVEAVELATRVPIMLLALLLGALVYRWASDLYGERAGLVALFLYVFDPAIVSGSQFNTTDIGAAMFGLLAIFAAWRATRHPRLKWIGLAGLALGLSMAAKVSGLFFAPVMAGLVGLTLLRTHWRRWNRLGKQTLHWAARFLLIYSLALGVVWAAYGFEFKPLPGLNVPVPAPSHWLVLQAFAKHATEGHLAFLAGQVSQYGWWWYFPLAFVLKTPLPGLLLLAIAGTSWIRQRRIGWSDDVWLLAVPLLYFANAMLSTIDIGYRHLLPILPFLFIFLGTLRGEYGVRFISSRRVPGRREWGAWRGTFYIIPRLAWGVLLAWYMIGAICSFPHYLSYFNELAGGPDGGWRYLADSNTDWGQAQKELAAYQHTQAIEQVRLSMFTFIDPAIYGVRYEPLTPMQGDTPAVFASRFNPPPGDYVISATTLQGIPLVDPDMFDWFRKRVPDAKIGHVMFAYHIKTSQARTWVAQCTTPIAPLEPEQVVEGFGHTGLRLAYFDCAQSWLYPTGGKSPGWVVLARDTSAWSLHWLGTMRLGYEQTRSGFSPPFRIYEQDESLACPQEGRAYLAPSEMTLADALTTPPIDLPVSFKSGLTLLGYAVDRPALAAGQTTHLETTWRVEDTPQRLLSLMAQALSPDGRAVAVGDGLGVPIESWQPGDVFVQRHALTLPHDTPPGEYWLQTGVYWLDNGERWAVRQDGVTGDRVLLTALQVR